MFAILRDTAIAATVGAAGALITNFMTVASLKTEVEAIHQSVTQNHLELQEWLKGLSTKQDDLRDRVAHIEGALSAKGGKP
jgi:hypothetical protein